MSSDVHMVPLGPIPDHEKPVKISPLLRKKLLQLLKSKSGKTPNEEVSPKLLLKVIPNTNCYNNTLIFFITIQIK